jgi:hypothetical protein
MAKGIRYCRHCGSVVDPAAPFCASCGRAQDAAAEAGQPAIETATAPDSIEWDIAFPLLTNRFFLYDMVKMLFWTFAIFDGILSSLFFFQKQPDIIPPFLGLSGLILLGFAVMIVAVAVLVFGNRFPTHFALDSAGLSYRSLSGRSRKLNRAALVIGILARKPGAAGAGLLAMSQEAGGIQWEKIYRIREYPAQRVLTIMNNWRVVVRLYCSPENYFRVAELVRSHAAAGALRRQHTVKAVARGPSPVPRMATLSLLCTAACAAILACPVEFEAGLLVGVMACALATIWLPGISRLSSALALAGTVLIAFLVVRSGTEVHELIPRALLGRTPAPRWSVYTRFGSMAAPEWIRFGIAAAGLIILGGLAAAALLGKLHRRKPVRQA